MEPKGQTPPRRFSSEPQSRPDWSFTLNLKALLDSATAKTVVRTDVWASLSLRIPAIQWMILLPVLSNFQCPNLSIRLIQTCVIIHLHSLRRILRGSRDLQPTWTRFMQCPCMAYYYLLNHHPRNLGNGSFLCGRHRSWRCFSDHADFRWLY